MDWPSDYSPLATGEAEKRIIEARTSELSVAFSKHPYVNDFGIAGSGIGTASKCGPARVSETTSVATEIYRAGRSMVSNEGA
jgi:hypothetical protein